MELKSGYVLQASLGDGWVDQDYARTKEVICAKFRSLRMFYDSLGKPNTDIRVVNRTVTVTVDDSVVAFPEDC